MVNRIAIEQTQIASSIIRRCLVKDAFALGTRTMPTEIKHFALACISEKRNWDSRYEPRNIAEAQASMRVIVVDDDPIFRSLVAAKLQKLSHEVVEAEDGGEAWSLIAQGDFQLALVDLEMPRFKGIELIRCIRSHPRTSRMPIVVVTSRNDSEAVRTSLEAGATSFVTKPLNWSMFSNHIEYLLRLHGAAERGHEIETRYVNILTELQLTMCAHLDRIRNEAHDALDRRKVLGGEQRMATALETVIREANSLRAMVAGAEQPEPIRNAS